MCKFPVAQFETDQGRQAMVAEALQSFASGVASGSIRTIDLTQTLSPDTPTLVLPPEFGQ